MCERECILSLEFVGASHSHTLLSFVEGKHTGSSPNDLNAKQLPWVLAK